MNITTITSLYIAGSLLTPVSVQAVELTEDFDVKGKPASSSKVKWSYRDELLPVRDWDSICPGDGFAYIKIDAIKANNKKKKWPFQTIAFSSVAPGHRIEMRAKNTVIKGVASFIFTYSEAGNEVDEIDIEVVGDDAETKPDNHPTDKTGWTDARFNTWANADPKTLRPKESHKKPIVDDACKKVSHDDGNFHTYRIDWYTDKVVFYVDGVKQDSISKVVPDSPSDVILGLRHMSWTGQLDWQGEKTMVIDWVKVTKLTEMKKAALERKGAVKKGDVKDLSKEKN